MVKKDDSNILDKFVSVGKINDKWNEIFDFTIKYFVYNKYSNTIINLIKKIKDNKIIIWTMFIIASWYWSQLLLNLMYLLMLFDSIILSLLVIQNNSVGSNARRLSKNIILISLTSLNLIGGILSLFAIIFIYMEWSKGINILIFKTIKFVLKTISNFFPCVYLMYPGIKLFSFDSSDMTIREHLEEISNKKKNSKKNKKHNVYSYIDLDLKNKKKSPDSSSSNYSDSSVSETNRDSDSSSDSKLSLNSKSYFPTISTIKKNIIKSKHPNKNLKNKFSKPKPSDKKKRHKQKNIIMRESSESIGSKEVTILKKFGLNKTKRD